LHGESSYDKNRYPTPDGVYDATCRTAVWRISFHDCDKLLSNMKHDGHLLLQVGEGSKGSAPEKGAPEKGTFWNAIKLIKP